LREEIKEIIKYRIEQAEDALKDAVLLFDSGGEEIGTGKNVTKLRLYSGFMRLFRPMNN
jgi:hypothetical protein